MKLYNTLTKQKEIFEPIDRSNVRMYVCGPTVYDYAHIGNARPVITFDLLYRLLNHTYGKEHVTYVRNFTDVDDKINDRAAHDFSSLPINDAIRKLTDQTIKQFHKDVDALGNLRPTIEPRATDHIEDMIDMIIELIGKGHAYISGREILFDTTTIKNHGVLSGRTLGSNFNNVRIEENKNKKNPSDFILWKMSFDDEPGWDSPWGIGRPGWHIECSAMSAKYLGKTFDIHGGGIDLIFPHHENEIAQSTCAHDTDVMANVWMHNGFLNVNGQKMAKSAGNFFTIKDLLKDWPGEVLRFNMLKTHYRQPIDFTIAGLNESLKTLDKWYDSLNALDQNEPSKEFIDKLSDDLNTPEVIALLHKSSDKDLSGGLRFLGFSNNSNELVKPNPEFDKLIDEIGELISDRNKARKAKDFVESDRIRTVLLDMGIVLRDRPNSTEWESSK